MREDLVEILKIDVQHIRSFKCEKTDLINVNYLLQKKHYLETNCEIF